MKHDKDLPELLAQVYGTLSDYKPEVKSETPPAVFVVETDTVYVNNVPTRVYLMKQEPLLCGNAPIIQFDDTLF